LVIRPRRKARRLVTRGAASGEKREELESFQGLPKRMIKGKARSKLAASGAVLAQVRSRVQIQQARNPRPPR
jgi:hypothetical protein